MTVVKSPPLQTCCSFVTASPCLPLCPLPPSPSLISSLLPGLSRCLPSPTIPAEGLVAELPPYLGQLLFPASLLSLLEDLLCGTEDGSLEARPDVHGQDRVLGSISPIPWRRLMSCLCLFWLHWGGELRGWRARLGLRVQKAGLELWPCHTCCVTSGRSRSLSGPQAHQW